MWKGFLGVFDGAIVMGREIGEESEGYREVKSIQARDI
jgi:hypothetical protein